MSKRRSRTSGFSFGAASYPGGIDTGPAPGHPLSLGFPSRLAPPDRPCHVVDMDLEHHPARPPSGSSAKRNRARWSVETVALAPRQIG
jgi:hypothetical protein